MLLPCSFAQRTEEWNYGLPKTKSYFDAAGKLVKQEDYTYQFKSQTLNNDTTWVSCKCGPKDKVMPTSIAGVNRNRISFNSNTYYPVTGRAELIKVTTKQFYLDNNFSTETTSYEYDPVYLTVRKITTENSNKETIEKRIYYPGNYNTSAYGYQQRMMSFNLIGMPVATETWLLKQGASAKLLNANISEFTQIQNADILPVATYEFMSAKPVDQNVIGVFDPSKLNRAPAYFKKTAASVYDSEGNLVQQEINGNVVSYIYAYDVANGTTTGRLIASVTNAAPGEVAFSGFETTGTKGGWTYSGPQLYHIVTPPGQPTVQSPDPVTGNFYYGLSNGGITKEWGLVEGKKYKLTYWIRGGFLAGSDPVLNLNYTSTTKQGPVSLNGYTYYEREFTAGASPLEITGSGYVDDVRLFPSDAQMTTYDYDAFDNVTHEMDENNRLTRYIYDSKQRVIQVQDQKGNILKVNEYKD
jgi:YD repeat-containing protein